jgi:hypothetical protein
LPPSTSAICPGLAEAVHDLPYWFVMGGQAVRCFAPYRPSRDVDFGIDSPANLQELIDQLARRGRVEIQERAPGTVHLLWNGIKVYVGRLLTPPARKLEIQNHVVDVNVP